MCSARMCPDDGGQRRGRGGVAHIGMGVENFEYPLRGSLRLLDLRKHAGARTEGADQNSGKEDECKEVARRHASVDDLASSIPQYRGGGGEGEEA